MPAPVALSARLAQLGDESLSDTELLAVACGVRVADAERFLAGDVPSGEGRATLRWLALQSFQRRCARTVAPRLPVLAAASAVAAFLRPDLAIAEVEELHVLALDSRNRLLRRVVVARGGVNQVSVTAREVFRPLLSAGAARAIVAHNHPSGCASPSAEDRLLTQRLAVAGELLGIPIVDHLIVAGSGYYSFAEHAPGPGAGAFVPG